MEPTGFDFDAARTELLGKDSDEIIDFIHRLNTDQSTDHISSRVKSMTVRLGWLRDGSSVLTPHGMSVTDSIREYVFWIERGRTLHCEGRIEHLSAAHYEGKSVIEIGCGFGCNLIPISKVAKRVVGVEPNSIYTAMSRILCEREGIAPMDIRAGSGEQIPVSGEVFDIVLCVSAHQYMDVRVSIREMARILAPGGGAPDRRRHTRRLHARQCRGHIRQLAAPIRSLRYHHSEYAELYGNWSAGIPALKRTKHCLSDLSDPKQNDSMAGPRRVEPEAAARADRQRNRFQL